MSRRSVDVAAPPSSGETPKISWTVRSVEPWLYRMVFEYPGCFTFGDRMIIPIGKSPPSLSSQVIRSTPLAWYADDARIFGTSVLSQVSPLLTESVVAQPVELCMSLHRFGVMKL